MAFVVMRLQFFVYAVERAFKQRTCEHNPVLLAIGKPTCTLARILDLELPPDPLDISYPCLRDIFNHQFNPLDILFVTNIELGPY